MFSAITRFFSGDKRECESWPIDLKLQKLGISGVIRDLHSIEREIVEKAFASAFQTLIASGARFKGTTFEYDGKKYDLFTSTSSETREINLIIQPRFRHPFELVSISRKIEEFGQIRHLNAVTPVPLRYLTELIVSEMNNVVRDGYLTLEMYFRRSFKSFGEFLFTELFTILNRQLERDGKIKLQGKAFFTVTTQKTKRFRYFFDGESLNGVIDRFKKQQLPGVSPVELIIHLLSVEAADTLNMIIDVKEGNFDAIASADYVSQDEDRLFWQAESVLINYESLTSFTIFKKDNLIFQVNCESKHLEQFRETFRRCSKMLQSRFEEQWHQYLAHATALKSIPRPRKMGEVNNVLLEQIGLVIGSAVATFVKKMSKI